MSKNMTHDYVKATAAKGGSAPLLLLAAVLSAVLTTPAQAQTSTIERNSYFEYDANGLLSKEVVEPDLPSSCLQTVYGRDVYGNKTMASSSACAGASGTALSSAGVARGTTNTYAAHAVSINGVAYSVPAGAFATASANALGQSESKTYDPRWGLPISLTGPNGLSTTWQYDGFGRKVRENRADGTYSTWSYQYCTDAGANCPALVGTAGVPKWVVSEQGRTAAGAVAGPLKRQYHDMLDRVIRVETRGFDGATGAISATLYQDTDYNSLGQISRKSELYDSTQTAVWTSFTYDAIGRVVTQSAPDPSAPGGVATTTSSYAGLTTSITNPKGQTKTTVRNISGQVAQVTDALGGVINYTYDPLGQLTKTDAAGQVTTLTYNQRGQKVEMLDPAMGSWIYAYNVFGELVSQRDSRSNTTTMVYDLLGRMTQRSEPDLISNWYYDKKADGTSCGAGIGKLCEATANNGYRRVHSYDSLGRPVQTATNLDSASSAAIAGTTYDSVTGRVSSKTWPANSLGTYQASYQYTPLGYLSTVTGSGAGATAASYQVLAMNARGQITQYKYGNNVTTVNTYNTSTGRLGQKQATLAGQAAGNVFNQSYNYDSLSNLTSRSDANTGVNEAFQYDSLNRLSQYSAVGGALSAGSVNSLVQVMYDARGNISYKSDVGQYWYDSKGRLGSITLTTPTGGMPLTGTRAMSHVFDDYLAGAQSVNGVTYGNGNLMYAVSQDIATGRNTVRWESFTSYNMVSKMRYANLSNVSSSAATGAISATPVYNCPSDQTLSETNCLTLSTSMAAILVGYSCSAGQELRGSTCMWTGVNTVTDTVAATPTCALGWNAAHTACNTWFPGFNSAPYYTCPSDYVLNGTSCVKTTNTQVSNTVAATPAYVCAGGQILSVVNGTSTCQSVISQKAASISYTCPAGYNLSQKTCLLGSGAQVNTAGMAADRQLNFLHGPEHQRIKQQVSLSNNAPTSLHSGTTWYLHGDNNDLFYEKEVRADGTIEHKHYLSAGGITFAIQTLREGTLNGKAPRTLNYLHHDHLGSTAAVTNEAGTVIERMAYDPWGKRRFVNGIADTTDSIVPTSTDRGFTMHEHLDEMGIIHMNGRIYDPYTGRFMSADPFIQAPGNLQSYNRYAYVMNNPLNLTDPSGYFSLKKLFRAAVSIAVAYYTGLQFGGLETLQGAVAGGFAGGVVSTGTLKGGLQGAFSAALFYGAGLTGTGTTQIEKANSLERYLAHAGAGCVSAVAGGGKCGQGMTAAVFGKFTTNQIEGWGGANKNSAEWLIAKGVATSIAGGAGSAIAGGKFDNGAATAAMGYLFNQVATILRLAGTYGPPLVAAAATQLDNLKEGARALSVMLSEGADKSAGDTPAPDREQTPTTNPENFDRIKGTKAKIDKETGEVWEHDQLHKDHWEVYDNKKDWEKGRRDRDVWDDGRPKRKF